MQTIKIITGKVETERYGYNTLNGYEPALELNEDGGGTRCLGNARYYNLFSEYEGKRIRVTIEELSDLVGE